MNWLDTQTKELLHKEPETKSAPAKAAEFGLILLSKSGDEKRLLRALCRINDCDEAKVAAFLAVPLPLIINMDLSLEDALSGQFELICCDSIAAFMRSEVLEEADADYLRSLSEKILNSPEFKPISVWIISVPQNEAGQRFADQFLGPSAISADEPHPFQVCVASKKARIMAHWAARIGADVRCEWV